MDIRENNARTFGGMFIMKTVKYTKKRKYHIYVYDMKGKLLHDQDLHGSADVNLSLGHLNKNFPTWSSYKVLKMGFVNEFGN